MNIYRIQTTSFDEEDFYIQTTLNDEQVRKVIEPIVESEREDESGETFYENEYYVTKLSEEYPNEVVEFYQEFETITI
jgi:hypothetical protein